MKKRILYILSACCILASCQDIDTSITSSPSEQDGELINVGGVTLTDLMEVSVSDPITRADGGGELGDKDAAEKQEWLITPLKQGLDITYGSVGNESATERVAILKLIATAGTGQELVGPTDNQYAVDSESKWAVYSFKYRVSEGEGENAVWHGNGAHYFEGQYVPTALRFGAGTNNSSSTVETVNATTAPGLHTNQTNKTPGSVSTGNYTLLEQYLGMPANTRLSATVARIKLPFRHRLCRVLAYVLIDPAIGQGVSLEGYKKTSEEQTSGMDDPETTELHFSNVDVLAGVEDVVVSGGHHTLTPKWMTARKVVPHFVGERGSQSKTGTDLDENFIVYMDLDNDTYTFPTDADWTSKKNIYATALANNSNDVAKTEAACKIRKINYGKVPVYDIIARPTYTKIENVMYDEDGVKNSDGTEDDYKKREYLAKKNKIDFDLTLSNGLQYSKSFSFDLDANFQTVVYLRISPASVDYNSSGAELWTNKQSNDVWYGIDNQNGNSLSIAGSSWQRAYTCGLTVTDGDKVTDGGFYNENTEGEDGTAGQYVTDATWIKYFSQAYEGGEHHGDYFILAKDITIDARLLPDNFVFTGHLNGYNPKNKTYHTITLTNNTGISWKEYIVTSDYTSDFTRYDTKPEDYSNLEGNVFALPDLYEQVIDSYYTQDECDEHNQLLSGYVTTSTVKIPEVKYTELEINDAVAKVDREGYVLGSEPEAIFATYPKFVKTPAVYYTEDEVETINAALDDFWTTSTVKEKHYILAPGLSLSQVAEGEYYTRNGDVYTAYTLPTLYKMVQHTSGTALFAGLNGIYSTSQEEAANPYAAGVKWEANVHKEKNDKGTAKEYWVPYKGESSGWRAEVINTKVKGGSMFTSTAIITGNVQNCYDGADATTKVENHTPEYPKYK